MSEVRSTFRLHHGDPAPEFSLPDPNGQMHSLKDLQGPSGLLVAFVCNHCPYVVHLAEALKAFADDISSLGIQTVAISSNDISNYPQDRPELMKHFALEHDWTFPYLYDASQEVAIAFGAACTPDFFLFDAGGKLFYTGQFDDSRPKNGQTPDGKDMHDAVERMLGGNPPPDKAFPSSGCNIKWKEGQQPEWWASGN